MKISRIQISNFLGARAVDLDLRKPISLISGKNGAGKSSIRDAIALAFTADLCRVSLKKEAASLITDGEESCFVEISTNADDTYGVAITAAGKISDTAAGKETLEAAGHRLALELECLLLDTKDLPTVSRWWASGMEALDEWQKLFPYNGPRLGD